MTELQFTDAEHREYRALLSADRLDDDAWIAFLVAHAKRVETEAREAIRAKPFGRLILILVDLEVKASRVLYLRRAYSARH